MPRIVLPKDIEVVVGSFGGVGTTFLMKYLANFKRLNDPNDKDGFKHSPLPPMSFNPRVKFLYVYGNPKLATISLFRRHYHHYQSRKLQKWVQEPINPVPKKMTLAEYAYLGNDGLHFENHFQNWYSRYLTHPTMFIRYETIFDSVEAILDFLEIPLAYSKEFPAKKERLSIDLGISPEIEKGLDKIYDNLNHRLSELGNAEVRVPPSPFFMSYIDKIYLKAINHQIGDSLKRHFFQI
jgi:hypothetical protein